MIAHNTASRDNRPESLNSLDTDTLWARYAQSRENELRNELLLRQIDLVKRVVSRLYASTYHYHDYDDLVSCGVIGLMDAFERFDPTRGVCFEAYAQIRIRGEIIDYMRRQDWAPTQLRIKIRRVEQAVEQLSQTLSRAPTDSEVANHLQIDLDDLQELFGQTHCLNLVHLEELLSGGEEHHALSSAAEFDLAYEKQESQEALRDEIRTLSERERLILNLYYDDELTLKEIGQVLKLTESRISQIHSSILLKLRTRLSQRQRVVRSGQRT